MSWSPVTGLPIQYSEDASGTAASEHYLKFYASGTTTPINMATDSTGGTTLAKCQLNSLGQAINGSSAVFIPHIDQKYKAVLYPDSTTADANTFASAIWNVDGITPSGVDALVSVRASGEFVKEFATMSAAIASTTLVEGDVLLIKDRANSYWDVVLSSGVTENGYNIVQGVGVGSLSFVLRITDNIYIPKAFGAMADGSSDDYGAIDAMRTAAEAVEGAGVTSVVFDFGASRYRLSAPITFTGISSCDIRGNFRITSTHSDDYILKFDTCFGMTISGKMDVRGNGSTTFSGRQNMFGVLFEDCGHITINNIEVYYTIGDGARFTGTSTQITIAKSQIGYCGSGISGATSASTATLSSQVQSGSINSTSQRDTLTLSAVPQQLKDYLDASVDTSSVRAAYIEINGDCHWIESYSGSTITVWPWVNTSHVGGTVRFIFGGGIFATGGDTSVFRIDNFSPIVCGIGYVGYSLYPASIGVITTQYCGIGIVQGYSTSDAAVGLDIGRGYFESNVFDILQASQADNALSIAQNTALNWAKVKRLYSGNSAGVPQTALMTSISVRDDYGFDYVSVGNLETSSTTVTLRLWTPEPLYLTGAATVTLSDDTNFRKVLGRKCKLVHWYSNTNGMTPSGSLTFTPPSGGTINGKAPDATQVFNTASGPAVFLVTCSSTDGLTWFVEPLAASTITKV